MPLTKWFFNRILIPGLGIIFTALLTAMFTKPELSLLVTLYGLTILGTGSAIVAIIDSTIGIIRTLPTVKRYAKIIFPISKRNKGVLLEIHNSEKQDELSDISVQVFGIEQFPDKFGKLPVEQRIFENKYFGLSHKSMDDRELTRKDGGGKRSGEVYALAGQSVFYYLFELDEYGSMCIPQVKIGEFPKGRYCFDFEFTGYVDNKITPDYISFFVENTGKEIVVENVETRP